MPELESLIDEVVVPALREAWPLERAMPAVVAHVERVVGVLPARVRSLRWREAQIDVRAWLRGQLSATPLPSDVDALLFELREQMYGSAERTAWSGYALMAVGLIDVDASAESSGGRDVWTSTALPVDPFAELGIARLEGLDRDIEWHIVTAFAMLVARDAAAHCAELIATSRAVALLVGSAPDEATLVGTLAVRARGQA